MVSSWLRTARAVEGYLNGDTEWLNTFQFAVSPDDPYIWNIQGDLQLLAVDEPENPESIALVVETIREFRDNEEKQALAERRGYRYDKPYLPEHPFLSRLLTIYDYSCRERQQPDSDAGNANRSNISEYIGNLAYTWDIQRGLEWTSEYTLNPKSSKNLRSKRRRKKSLES